MSTGEGGTIFFGTSWAALSFTHLVFRIIDHFGTIHATTMFYRNVQCGKLWCIGNSTITPKDHGYNYLWSNGTLNSRRIICR